MVTVVAAVTDADGALTPGWGTALAVLLGVLALALLVLVISALVSIVRADALTTGGKVLWAVVVFAFPFIGSLAWLIWGRGAVLQRPAGQASSTMSM
ncbi:MULTISPECIES: PLD nuclease N-terminal domain-containing protein [Corynebacterium]|jgi:hypothetical protein|uniref:PLD nuclease N-terminal domain-containing protein n=1 Tax=Corynebacterium TaxID=1716 RepID=UPI0009902EDB|nr:MULTISPECIES: PLD nuclease N-terminal domain-containing protein [Corynebacterium]MCI1257393.1 PLD nuclease N-terminal domain-containing protein [Corynebacterium provencense]